MTGPSSDELAKARRVLSSEQTVGPEEAHMAIGATLRQAREQKGLSLDRLSKTTRVQTRLLDAIERDDHSVLPPRPYARGMVSAYAREVGLDANLTAREYFADIDAREAEAAALAPPPAEDDQGTRVSAPLLVFLALVGIGAAVLWTFPAGSPTDTLQAVGTSGSAEPAAVATSGPVAQATQQPPATPGEMAIDIEASAPSWVAATADGSRVVYRTMQAGERETLRGARAIELRVGNAGAITWTINGQGRGPMGRSGEVRDVTISPETVSTVR